MTTWGAGCPYLPLTQHGTDWRWKQLDIAVRHQIACQHILWAMFAFFGATSAILVAALFSDRTPPENGPGAIICATGAVLSLVWRRVQEREVAHLEFFESIVERLERVLVLDTCSAVSGYINTRMYNKYLAAPSRLHSRKVMVRAVAFAIWCWTIGFGLIVASALYHTVVAI